VEELYGVGRIVLRGGTDHGFARVILGAMAAGPLTFVGHDASRTGAPMVLRSLLSWARARRVLGDASLVLLRGGPLLEDFRSLLPTTVLDTRVRRIATGIAAGLRAVAPMAGERPAFRRFPPAARLHGTVVANTLAALPVAAGLCHRSATLICHVHELDGVAARILPRPEDRREAVGRVDHFVACSAGVRSMLVDRWAAPDSKVSVVHEFVDRPSQRVSREDARRRLGSDQRTHVVLGVGAAGPRKGTDHFLSLAATIEEGRTGPRATWVGGDPGSAAWQEMRHDVEKCGLNERVTLVPTIDDPGIHLAAADLLVTTSREDPYPLAVLEAAVRGIPVAGFGGSGWAEMATEAGCDDLVHPVGDVLGLARSVEELLGSSERRAGVGDRLAAWALAERTTETAAPLFWETIGMAV